MPGAGRRLGRTVESASEISKKVKFTTPFKGEVTCSCSLGVCRPRMFPERWVLGRPLVSPGAPVLWVEGLPSQPGRQAGGEGGSPSRNGHRGMPETSIAPGKDGALLCSYYFSSRPLAGWMFGLVWFSAANLNTCRRATWG